ncbi:hypothetical protein NQ317_003899 [Molorchus minor]|uniref:DUF5641 domain-containing protein n=1 Tax=Molorchus minor TaxID=1323400 RepID=A0ABQ9J817_9CUCU|nr:hypothetical protein NQ317_003899 [Molorchus minor]
MEISGYDMSDVEGNIRVLTQKMELIQDLDKQTFNFMLEKDVPDEEVEAEVSRADDLVAETENLLTLTPAMFLQDIRENGVPDLDNIGEVPLKRRARYLLQVRESLRKRFRKEYLSQLVLFSFNRDSNRHLTDYKLGDVVIIETENLKDLTGLWLSEEISPRQRWKKSIGPLAYF